MKCFIDISMGYEMFLTKIEGVQNFSAVFKFYPAPVPKVINDWPLILGEVLENYYYCY